MPCVRALYNGVCPGVIRWCVSGRYTMVCVSLYLEVAVVIILHVFMSLVTDVTLDLMTVYVCLCVSRCCHDHGCVSRC